MTRSSTTIRVSVEQRELLRQLSAERESTMADTLDDALEALRRDHFYSGMAEAEQALRSNPSAWQDYVAQRDAWLSPGLTAK